MKKRFISTMVLVCMLTSNTFANTIENTNLDDLNIYYEMDNVATIELADFPKEYLEEDGVLLFINGSIVLGAGAMIENDRVLVPIRVVSEQLNATVDWIEPLKQIDVTKGEDAISLVVGSHAAHVNGNAVTLDTAPQIIDNATYVPLRFISEALGATVSYSDGEMDNDRKNRTEFMINEFKQVMISKYDTAVTEIGREKALELVYDELVYAYEKRFEKEFIPLYENPYENKPYGGDEEGYRYTFSNLEVLGETDRFYVIPVVWDFWVDKYTGKIYTYYNGASKVVKAFDKDHPGALAFAG